MAERRRLPVIQEPKREAPPEEGAADRPAWHWVGFGTVAIFAAWLPLAYAAGALVRSALDRQLGGATSPADVAARLATMTGAERMRIALLQTVPHLFALGIAAFGGGWIVGRYGPKAGPREGAACGLVVSVLALAAASKDGGLSVASLVLVPLAVGFAALGAARGRAGRAGKAGGGR